MREQRWFVDGIVRGFTKLETALTSARRRYPQASWTKTPWLRGETPCIFGTWGRKEENVITIEFRY